MNESKNIKMEAIQLRRYGSITNSMPSISSYNKRICIPWPLCYVASNEMVLVQDAEQWTVNEAGRKCDARKAHHNFLSLFILWPLSLWCRMANDADSLRCYWWILGRRRTFFDKDIRRGDPGVLPYFDTEMWIDTRVAIIVGQLTIVDVGKTKYRYARQLCLPAVLLQ